MDERMNQRASRTMAGKSAPPPGLVLTCLTDDPALAAMAAAAGVERIGPDLEKIGKAERQPNLGTRLSWHSINCLPALISAVKPAALFVRINPIHSGSEAEIETVLTQGTSVVMLPYFHSLKEVERFVALVGGRARTVALVETAAAAFLIDRIAAIDGLDEIHVGLTDMMISSRVGSRYVIMTSEMMSAIAAAVRSSGKPFHLAGVARIDDATMPMPSDLTLARFAQLGVEGALLTRAFLNGLTTVDLLAGAVQALRDRYTYWSDCAPPLREEAAAQLRDLVDLRVAAGIPLP